MDLLRLVVMVVMVMVVTGGRVRRGGGGYEGCCATGKGVKEREDREAQLRPQTEDVHGKQTLHPVRRNTVDHS